MTIVRLHPIIPRLLMQARMTSAMLAMRAELNKRWIWWSPADRHREMQRMIGAAAKEASLIRATDFRVGQRVRMTEKAIRNGLQGYAKTRMGTVRRIPRDTTFIIHVQRDGLKGVNSYHCDFWGPVVEVRGRTFREGRGERPRASTPA